MFMAKTISNNQPSETSTRTISVPIIPWGNEYRTVAHSGLQSDLTNIQVGIGDPSTFRFNGRSIKNVYSNTPIDANYQAPSKKGTEAFLQRNEVWSIKDSSDPSYEVKIPVSCAIRFTVPAISGVDGSAVEGLITRTLAGLYTDDSTTRLDAILRLAVNPLE